ncbi:MAG: hypothetical protein K6T78_00795 [Alicyclobacillus sp.]|nr:hypothetical protein [Alicyclobacillus sp.]
MTDVAYADEQSRWPTSRSALGSATSSPAPEQAHCNDTWVDFNGSIGAAYELTKAVRQHVRDLFQGMPSLHCAVAVAGVDGYLLDVVGPRSLMGELEALGLCRGALATVDCPAMVSLAATLACGRLSTHAVTSPQPLASAACPIRNKAGDMRGAVTFIQRDEQVHPLLAPLVQSCAIAAAHHMELEAYRRDAQRVHQSLLSHLDYHVVRVTPDGHIEAHHPVPVREEVRRKMVEYAREGSDGDSEFVVGDHLYSCNLRVLRDPIEGDGGRLAVFRDITSQRLLESRVRDADKLSILASLAAGIAHEIRNPLTTAKGFLQLFAERQGENADKRYLNLTIRELNRIQDLVKDFMTLARPVPPLYEDIDLHALIRTVLDFLHPEALLNDVTLAHDLSNEPVYIHADANQMKQVLLNVLQNALHACDRRGRIEVSTGIRSASVVISIRDTGRGISPEQQAKVFQPFYTTKPTGTGLGLAVSRQIMQEHGGSIELSSELGTGTTVRLVLPLARSRPPG